MDRLSRLQALLGNDQVEGENVPGNDFPPWTHWAKPQHLYEGTDSEDDEKIVTRRVEVPEEESGTPPTEIGPGKKILYLINTSLTGGLRSKRG